MLSHGPIYRIYYNTYIIHLFFDPYKVCLFGLIHNVPVNNFSVMLGRVVMGLARTKQRIKDDKNRLEHKSAMRNGIPRGMQYLKIALKWGYPCRFIL